MDVTELLRTVNLRRKAFEDAGKLYRDRLAPDFNPFDFIKPDEMRLSGILAWLLDPRATHGQGGRFLRLFLDRLAAGWPPDACDQAEVKTESWVEEGRLDIIARSGNRVLVIENKPWAANQPAQLKRYLTHLDQLMRDDRTLKPADFPLIYLNGDGSAPPENSLCEAERRQRTEAGQLHCWSYREHVLEWVTQCRAACRADRVSTFIDEFARYIEKTFAGVADVAMQDHLVEEIANSAAMVASAMQIVLAGDTIRGKLLSKLQGEVAAAVKSERWELTGNLAPTREAYLYIDFSQNCPCMFGVGFTSSRYREFCYGTIKKELNQLGDAGVRDAIEHAIGNGPGNPNEPWPWWRNGSSQDSFLPYEPDWCGSEQPWAAIPDGTMAKSIVEAARRFRDALSGRGLL